MRCRHCDTSSTNVFVDLGFAPPSNAYISSDDLRKVEKYYPLRIFVCNSCKLVQTEDFADATELFSDDYAYLSSTSKHWLSHAQNFCDVISERLGLSAESLVVEVAANDGYLLKNFMSKGIPCLGIEPTESTAAIAETKGIPIIRDFFSAELARELRLKNVKADLVVGNNVFAHVPDINDFAKGLGVILKPRGIITLEFPHLLQLLCHTQFDTIYHEHFSYLSLHSANQILDKAGLMVCDVDEISTHGGSLRLYISHKDAGNEPSESVSKLLEREEQLGIKSEKLYDEFQTAVERIKNNFLKFLIEKKETGYSVCGYGAAAKGCTLINFAGVKPDLLPYVCDAAPSKQNQFLPGSHVPILHPKVLKEKRPDYVIIFPWNIKEEIVDELSYIREWNGKFVVAVPELQVFS